MSEHRKRQLGTIMIVIALVLGVRAFSDYRDAGHDAGTQNMANRLVEQMSDARYALLGVEEPDRSGAQMLGGVAAVLFLGGIVLVAVAQAPDEE